MAKINLLPWREAYREEKKKEFLAQLVLVCLFAFVVAFVWIQYMDGAIENQKNRNQFLNDGIAKLEERVKEIQALKKKREELIARMRVIQDLQGTRPTIVRYFDEVVRAVPDGLFFQSMKRTGDKISIVGVTESSNRVSSFMRNLDRSEWFTAPNLKSIKADKKQDDQSAVFTLELKAVLPASMKQEEGA